ncbi:MAG: GAF domain-containing protein, partial [Chloroflexota bacterium]
DFPGKNHFDLYPDPENEAIFRQVRDTGEPYRAVAKPYVYEHHRERGVSYWDWSLIPVLDAARRVEGLLLGLVNVTEGQSTEKALQVSEERYRVVSNLISDFAYSFILTEDGHLIPEWGTGAMMKTLGVSIEDIYENRRWKDILITEDLPVVFNFLRNLVNGQEGMVEFRLPLAEGKICWLRNYSRPIKNETGQIVRILGAVQDITAIKLAEQETRQYLRELETLNKTGRIITSTLDLYQVLGLVNEEIRLLLETEVASILMYDEERSELIFAAASGPGSESLVGMRMPASVGIAGWVLQNAKPLLINQAQKDTRFYPHIDAITGQLTHSLMAVPLIGKQRAIGVIEALNPHGGEFSEHQLELLSALGGSAAAAIENARLYQDAQTKLVERERAEEEARRQADRAGSLARLASRLNEQLDMNGVLQVIGEEITRALYVPLAGVLLYDETLSDLYYAGHWGVALTDAVLMQRIPATLLQKQMAHNGPAFCIPDIHALPDFPNRDWLMREKIRTLGVAVMMHEGKLVGILCAASIDIAAPFNRDELKLLQAIADQAAVSIQKIRLFEETKRSAQELEAIARVSAALRRAVTRAEMLQILAEKTMEVLVADEALLLVRQGDVVIVGAAAGYTELKVGDRLPQCEHWSDTKPWHTGSRLEQKCTTSGLCCHSGKDVQACSGVTFHTIETTVGILHLSYHSPERYTDSHRRLLQAIAEMAGNALHRASVMESLEERVEDRTRQLTALYNILATADPEKDLKAILERCLEQVCKAVGCQYASIELLDDSSDRFELAASKGWQESWVQRTAVRPGNAGLPGLVRLQNRPVVLHDIPINLFEGMDFGERVPKMFVVIPLNLVSRFCGILSVSWTEDRNVEEDMALLSSIADHIILIIENIRLQQQAKKMAVLEERTRLSRDIHDSVTQSMYSMTLFTEAAQVSLKAGQVEQAAEHLLQVKETIVEALRDMRLLIYELRRPSFENQGLISALHSRMDAVERRAGVNARLTAEKWIQLPAEVEKELYWITIEALNNSLKHAKATEVKVLLRPRDSILELEISDNGQGFDVETAGEMGGMGLKTMRERALKLGGSLNITSTINQGTMITVLIPFQSQEAVK